MKDDSIQDFYFDNLGEIYISGYGDVRCGINCIEWSDGRLACFRHTASIVQKSHRTGKFIWYADYVDECREMGESDNAEHYGFNELREAYHQFEPIGKLEEKDCVALLMEIIRAYNDKYDHNYRRAKKVPIADYIFFIKCILEVQRRGKEVLPASIRAELYREAGLFEECFGFDAAASRSRDEMEIIAEIQFRAAHRDKEPFIIEHCEFYRRNIRFIKRTPCPRFND